MDKLSQLIADLQEIEQKFQKEGQAYLKLANIVSGSSPKDLKPENQGLINSSGTYQLCAKEIRDLLRKYKSES